MTSHSIVTVELHTILNLKHFFKSSISTCCFINQVDKQNMY